jgi:phage terminase large subunit
MITKHKAIWNNLGNNTRYFIITGGRGSGKSFEVSRFCSLLTFESRQKILLTRQTMTSAHLSIIPEFKDKIDLLNLNHYFDILKTEIKNNKTNSEIIFRGLKTSSGDQTANLKSLQGISTWILDEAEELTSESVFDKINLSIRQKGVQNRIISILNPTTKEHFIYKKFFQQAGVKEGFTGVKGDVTYIHSTYLHNIENLDPSFIAEAERMRITNPTKYNHVMLGGWLNKAEGVIFKNWVLGDFQIYGSVIFGQDYGFSIDPTTLVKCSIDSKNKKIFVDECLYSAGLNTTQIYIENSKYVQKELIIADSAEPRLISELKQKGLNVKGISKPLIIDRIALMQDYQIVVTPNSINIIKELNNYVWHDKKSQTPVDAYNHLIDPICYVLWDLVSKPKLKYKWV